MLWFCAIGYSCMFILTLGSVVIWINDIEQLLSSPISTKYTQRRYSGWRARNFFGFGDKRLSPL